MKDMNAFNVIEYLKKDPFDIDEFLLMINRAELLSREEEQALIAKVRQGDDEAMNQLLCAKARFVVALAAQYQNRGVSLKELIATGNGAMKQAAREYNTTAENSFIGFAVPIIRRELEDCVKK